MKSNDTQPKAASRPLPETPISDDPRQIDLAARAYLRAHPEMTQVEYEMMVDQESDRRMAQLGK